HHRERSGFDRSGVHAARLRQAALFARARVDRRLQLTRVSLAAVGVAGARAQAVEELRIVLPGEVSTKRGPVDVAPAHRRLVALGRAHARRIIHGADPAIEGALRIAAARVANHSFTERARVPGGLAVFLPEVPKEPVVAMLLFANEGLVLIQH